VAEFRLPDLGEGITEAEIARWLVTEGDAVSEDDALVEVVTDKATVEIPSPFAGTVARIHAGAGEVVPVGTVLVTIGGPPLEEAEVTEAAQAEVTEPAAVEVAARAAAGDPPGEEPATVTAPSKPAINEPRKARAMPPVRRLARTLDVDIDRVEGSGRSGRVLRSDVEAFARGRGEDDAEAASGPPTPDERREPLRGVRRTIAERMAASHRSIPAVTHVEECDVTELDATRRLANERSTGGPRLTYLSFVVKAVVAGLKAHPALNASLDEAAGEIVYHQRYHIGIAVDTPAGLVVPVIRDADQVGLREVGREIERLAKGAREQTLDAAELRGGTFSITSPGRSAGLMATPIILHPQAGILGVHRALDRPVARDGQVVIRKVMNLSITFDHRVLDGMTAARFCSEVVALLEHPGALALEG
jgi:pyruvate dehydrogenase E2 component (dihydrolipoamide acetyltransferase)